MTLCWHDCLGSNSAGKPCGSSRAGSSCGVGLWCAWNSLHSAQCQDHSPQRQHYTGDLLTSLYACHQDICRTAHCQCIEDCCVSRGQFERAVGILPVKDMWQRSLPGIVSELPDQLVIGSATALLNRTGRKGRQQSDLGTCVCVSIFSLSLVSSPVLLCSPARQCVCYCVCHTNKQLL